MQTKILHNDPQDQEGTEQPIFARKMVKLNCCLWQKAHNANTTTNTHFLTWHLTVLALLSLLNLTVCKISQLTNLNLTTRMWANAQRDGRPAEYRWRPLFNAAKFG